MARQTRRQKAERLISERRIQQIDLNHWLVVGEHGRYIVSPHPSNGILVCSCPFGGRTHGNACSHTIAVGMVIRGWTEQPDLAPIRHQVLTP